MSFFLVILLWAGYVWAFDYNMVTLLLGLIMIGKHLFHLLLLLFNALTMYFSLAENAEKLANLEVRKVIFLKYTEFKKKTKANLEL